MKNQSLKFKILTLCILFVFTDCKKDDIAPLVPTGRTKSYIISNTDLSSISGTVTFIENDNNSTTLDFDLQNTSSNVNNPIYLRRNTAFEGGELAAIIGNLDGSTGKSSFNISGLANDQSLSYDQLLVFDGYIAIELEESNSGEIAAYSDIGPNELTGNKVIYSLLSPEDFSFKAQATFAERLNGTTSVVIGLVGSSTGIYPSHIHNQEDGSEDEILITLSPVEETFNGNGFSEISELNGVPLLYTDLLQLNASIDVHDSNDTTLVIATCGIGSNPDANSRN